VDSSPSALRKQMSGGCYNNRHVDLGSFRVDDDFVFIAVYALLRSVALRLAGSCGLFRQPMLAWVSRFWHLNELGGKRVTRGKSRDCRGVSERVGE